MALMSSAHISSDFQGPKTLENKNPKPKPKEENLQNK